MQKIGASGSLLSATIILAQFGDGQRLQCCVDFNQYGSVGANRDGCAQCLLALGRAARYRNYLRGSAFLLQAHGLFRRDLV